MNEIRSRTRFEAAALGLRLARSIAARFDIDRDAQLGDALAFSVRLARDHGVREDDQAAWRERIRGWRASGDSHPLSRIAAAIQPRELADLVADLVLLAALPEVHEGYASLFRLMHPDGRPHATVSLALHWLEDEAGDAGGAEARAKVEELLLYSSLARVGIVRLEGEGPWHGRTLRPGPGVWEALNARPPRLESAELLPGFRTVPGMSAWLEQDDSKRALRALVAGTPCMIAFIGEPASARATRVRALLGAAGMGAVRMRAGPSMTARERRESAVDAYCASFMHNVFPWIDLDASLEEPAFTSPAGLQWDLPVIVGAPAERALPQLELPILVLRVDAMSAVSRRAMWSALLPQLGSAAGILAARYPIDAEEARDVVADLALRQATGETDAALGLDDVGTCLRARTSWRARPGVRRVSPRAQWSDLLIPGRSAAQLTEAVLRVHEQITVLDDWGFEQGRNERRGLRMLFHGPPGTGKTLAAEAMARALGVDLLVVDIASLVSKWIGETEKNLAAVFELAESSRAVLLFDEAEALFGRRSEGHDANDRYANLETAFLLQRLERYEGVAVLATNLRGNLDPAFTRRFEFIVEFPEPDAATRARLWKLHLPETAPLAADVDLDQLAGWYAISGAQIRNAALGAAFFAAGDAPASGARISQEHFLRAIEREFEKSGKAHPGNPSHIRSTASS